MSVLVLGRLALLVVALVAVHRSRGPLGMAVAGVAGAAAVFGPRPVPLPVPVVLGAGLFGAALVLALLGADVHSPLAGEAGTVTFSLASAAALVATIAYRGAGLEGALLGGAAVGAGLSAYGAGGCLANAEAGWRRGFAWACAVALPGLVAGGALALGDALPAHLRLLGPAIAILVALLAWVPPFLLERRRILRELSEEARLGILPGEDLAALGSPWRRAREVRFGRADERREFVRSALLLAVARQQQRRRSGEAIRLRQLEVLAFRTRVRRAVQGREARFGGVADETFL